MADRTKWHQGSVSQVVDDQSVGNDLTVGDDIVVTDAASFLGPITFADTFLHSATQTETVSINKTLDSGDSGVFQLVDTDAVVVTLPATAVGLVYTIINVAADAAALVSISPNAADKILGNGFTATDDKDAQNTKATAKRGDMMRLVGDGSLGWYVAEVRGIWARE